jgi:hypothetical protein
MKIFVGDPSPALMKYDLSGNESFAVNIRYLTDCVRFEVFTALTMKNGVFWDVTPCGSCENRRFGGT